MNNVLLIDTSSNKEIKVGVRIDKKEHLIRAKLGRHKAQAVLPLIDKILNRQGLKITDITGITVNATLGSFTGIRVGMAIANALSLTLKIPVEKI